MTYFVLDYLLDHAVMNLKKYSADILLNHF